MRSIRTVSTLAAIAFAPAVLAAQEPFEGTVAYNMQMGGMSIDMVHHIKGGRVRQEMIGVPGMGEMVVLLDTDSMKMTMMMPGQQVYMTRDLQQMADMARQQQEQEGYRPDIERTGQMETVAGHRCENVRVVAPQGTMTMCVATDLGFYFMGGASGGGGMGGPPSPGINPEMEGQIREMFGDGFFPLKMSMAQNDMSITMVATEVERKPISDDLFEVPEGYRRMPGGGVDDGGAFAG